jgi:hypothetical protein
MIPRTGIGSGGLQKYISVPLPDPDKQGKDNSGHAENRKKFISMASSRGSSFDFNPDSVRFIYGGNPPDCRFSEKPDITIHRRLNPETGKVTGSDR